METVKPLINLLLPTLDCVTVLHFPDCDSGCRPTGHAILLAARRYCRLTHGKERGADLTHKFQAVKNGIRYLSGRSAPRSSPTRGPFLSVRRRLPI